MSQEPAASQPSVQRIALAVSVLSSFLTPFMGSAMNVALPAVALDFSLSAVALGWVAMAYQLTAAMFLVPFGRLADIIGRKKVFGAGIAVYTAASAICALAPGPAVLITLRAVQGVGGAMIFGTGVAILTSVFPPGERGKALGLSTAAVYLGLSLGPVLGGVMTQSLGWRSLFWVNIPVGLAALFLVLKRLKGEWAEARGERFDSAGAAIFGLGLASLMYGFTRLPSGQGIVLSALGVAGILAFAAWETRVSCPVLDVRLFRCNRVFAFSNLAALINYSATSAVSFLLSLYLQYVKGLTPRQAGLILITQPLVMAASSPWAGRLSDKTEPRTIASLGMTLTSAGLLLFAFLREGTSLASLIGGLILLGIGFGLFSSPNTNAVMGAVERRLYGVASAALGTMRLSGQMLSLGLTMMIFSLFLGGAKIQPEVFSVLMKSFRTAFFVFSALCAAGVLASLARGNRCP